MRTLLRRVGIMAFAGLSFVLWKEAAYTTGPMQSSLISGPTTLVLGASLACLGALLLSEMLGWGMSLLESTRREFVVANLEPISWLAPESAEQRAIMPHPSSEELTDGVNDLVKEGNFERRDWVDVRQRDLAEAVRQ